MKQEVIMCDYTDIEKLFRDHLGLIFDILVEMEIGSSQYSSYYKFEALNKSECTKSEAREFETLVEQLVLVDALEPGVYMMEICW